MKKLISTLLVLCLLMALSGCAGSIRPVESTHPQQQEETDPVQVELSPATLEGSWQTTMNLSEFLTTELCEYEALQMGILVTDFYATLNMEFHADGTYRAWVDTQSIDESMAELKEILRELLWQDVEMLYVDPESELTLEEVLKKEGVDPDKDLEEVCQHLLSEGYVGQLQGRIDREGRFEILENELYLSKDINEDPDRKSCDIVELYENELTFVENYGAEDFEGYLLYPLTLERVG